MSGSNAAEVPVLRALASDIPVHDPAVRRFVIEALRTVEALSAELAMHAEGRFRPELHNFIDGGHRDRLDMLIIAQQAELDESSAVVERVRALVDFSSWAATDSGYDEPAIQVADLRRALGQAGPDTVTMSSA